jgi:hypothetical protein
MITAGTAGWIDRTDSSGINSIAIMYAIIPPIKDRIAPSLLACL